MIMAPDLVTSSLARPCATFHVDRLARDFERAGEIVVGGIQHAELVGEVAVVGRESEGARAAARP
jgi:hypothetical protein